MNCDNVIETIHGVGFKLGRCEPAGMIAPRREKWRPSLGLVIFTVLASVAVLPLVGLFFFRLYDNQLIRQTQAELIAQSRVLAAIYAREVEARLGSGIALGAEVPPKRAARSATTSSRRSGPRSTSPPATTCCGGGRMRLPRARPAQPAYVEIGARLMPIILETQKVTLAGFRILDPQRRGDRRAATRSGNRWPISRRWPTALRGQYRAALRNPRARQAAAADLFVQPRRRRARVLGDARDRQQPRRRRDLHLADAEQHLRPSLSGARQVHPGGACRHPRARSHRPGVLPHHHAADARAGRSRRAHQPRRPRRVSAARRITARASSPSCRTAFSTWPSNCRGARIISRPSRPTSPTS